MIDRSDDPSHHEITLLPQSYISLHSRYNFEQEYQDSSDKEVNIIGEVCLPDASTTQQYPPPWFVYLTTRSTLSSKTFNTA